MLTTPPPRLNVFLLYVDLERILEVSTMSFSNFAEFNTQNVLSVILQCCLRKTGFKNNILGFLALNLAVRHA